MRAYISEEGRKEKHNNFMTFYRMKLTKHIKCGYIIIYGDLNDLVGNLPVFTIVGVYMKAHYNGNGNELRQFATLVT
jgi:hypothetical protein